MNCEELYPSCACDTLGERKANITFTNLNIKENIYLVSDNFLPRLFFSLRRCDTYLENYSIFTYYRLFGCYIIFLKRRLQTKLLLTHSRNEGAKESFCYLTAVMFSSDYEMDFIGERYYKINKILLNILGLWPSKTGGRIKLEPIFCSIIFFSFLFVQVVSSLL